MSAYMITYFISDTCGCGGHHHDHDHEHTHEHVEDSEGKIIGKIKSVGSWANFMPEGYLVKSTKTAQEIYDEIQPVANKGDMIFVAEINADTFACENHAVIEWIRS